MFKLNANNPTPTPTPTPMPTPTPKVNSQQIAFVKDFLSKKGMSAETMVRQLCNQRGINVEEFMEQFRDVNIP